jgi:hypothetical protein
MVGLSESIHGLLQAVFVEIDSYDPRSSFGKGTGRGSADSTRSAGYEDSSSFESGA